MTIDFDKTAGLVPAVIQDAETLKVLMLGYMNAEAFRRTQSEGRVTFYSRSRKQLWTKGETSGNFLVVKEIAIDCDQDTLLILVVPTGPVCHTGSQSCFAEANSAKGFLYELEKTIDRKISTSEQGSYTNSLFKRGINKIAQKVGEEAVELIIESKDDNMVLFKDEAADLLFHLLILLRAKNVLLGDIESVLRERNRKSPTNE